MRRRSLAGIAAGILITAPIASSFSFLFLVDFSGLNVTLGLLMFLQMSFLPEENSARSALKRSYTLMDPLVHVTIAGRSKDLFFEGEIEYMRGLVLFFLVSQIESTVEASM